MASHNFIYFDPIWSGLARVFSLGELTLKGAGFEASLKRKQAESGISTGWHYN